MNMGDITEAINVLRYFCRQTPPVTANLAHDCFVSLKKEADMNGLSEVHLNVCAEFIVKKCKTSSLMKSILQCMVPKKIVPDNIVRTVLFWTQTHFQQGFSQAVVFSLQWVAGLLEFGLVDEKPVNEYYYLFITLLDWTHTQKIACWLVVRLTKPNDVDRNAVVRVLQSKYKTKSKHLDIILWCFKTFKPECVFESVASSNVLSSLRLPPTLKQSFEQAHQRNVASTVNFKSLGKCRIWQVNDGGKKSSLELIPRVQYVHFGSSLYRKKKTSVLEITDWKQVSIHMLNIDIPCNVMSLLQNPYGHHIIAFGGETLQHRLSYTLFSTLQNVIVERLVEIPISEQENLLNKVCELQEYMQEGIPVMTRFLASYIPFWDGITFLPQLLRLLPWITFLTFGELRQVFLVDLYYVYISSNIHVKCSLLRCLRKLIGNILMELDIANVKLFLNTPKLENAEEVVFHLIRFVESLCILGLNFEQDNGLILNDVLNFYEFLVEREEELKLQERSFLPAVAVYYCLFSRNFVNVERVCDLLLKYNAFYKSQISSMKFLSRVNLLRRYKNDFINLLWHGLAFSRRKRGYIFKGLERNNVQKIANIINLDEAFILTKQIPFIYGFGKKGIDDPAKRKAISAKFLQIIFPSIYNLLKAILAEKGEHLLH